jgi:predicted RNA-binding protein with PIN domain
VRYVIDACNLIFQDRELEEMLDARGFPAVREALARRLGELAHAQRLEEVVLVFDGSEKAAHRPRTEVCSAGRIRLLYANPREQADRTIIALVEDSPRPGEITVISNDKFIVRHIRGAGAHHVGCREFLRHLRGEARRRADPLRGEDPRKFRGLSAREVEEELQWQKMHGAGRGRVTTAGEKGKGEKG